MPILAFLSGTAFLDAGAIAPRWAVVAIGLPIVSRLDPRALPRSVAISLACGWLWATASLAWTPDRLTAVMQLFQLSTLCLAFIAGSGLDDLDGVVRGFAPALIVVAALCLAGFPPHQFGDPITMAAVIEGNREYLAEFAAPVAAFCVMRRWWLVAGLIAVPLLYCRERLALAAFCVAVLWAAPWSARAKLPGFILIAAAAVVSLHLGGHDLKALSAVGRFHLWYLAIRAIVPFGQGVGWSLYSGVVTTGVHSDVLQLIGELGVGAIFFVLPLASALFAALAAPQPGRSWPGATPAERALMLAIGIEAAFSFPFRTATTGFLGAVAAGRLAGRCPYLRVGRSIGSAEDGLR